ncbi:LuxR family transcriptional regulator [Ensifer aridi]|uniref:LuxR family transcriptional regulator n=1 Tax=Ensifer aridi TaxID=1708715 RepID=UPI001FCCC807|nr:LuxR family transcriptional regulator [Ensifer aridi]
MSKQFSTLPSMHLPMPATETLAIEFGRFLDESEGVVQTEQLFELLSAFALSLDFPWIAYGPLTPDQKIMKRVRLHPGAILNYPDESQEHYAEVCYDGIEPIFKKSRRQASPFRWSEVYNDVNTTEVERRLFDKAAKFGLRSGVSVPLHGPGVGVSVMTFARPCRHRIQTRTITYLQLAASHFHLRLAEFSNPAGTGHGPNLSPRERECILWVARGKSSWDIGIILGITENTVNFHIKNVLRKFNVTSRTVAALKAAALGIIEL